MDETNAEKIARLRANIRSLETAMATGVRSAYSDGERIEYQTTDLMDRALSRFKADLAIALNLGRSRWGSTYVTPTMRW